MNSIEDEFYSRFSARVFVLKWMIGIGVVLFVVSFYWVMSALRASISFHVEPQYYIYMLCLVGITYLLGSIIYDHVFPDRS